MKGKALPRFDSRPEKARVNRRAITVAHSFAEADAEDRAFWSKQSPQARLRAMELLRRINYGKAATGRLQRVLEIVQSPAR
jgi:hypothetical protein